MKWHSLQDFIFMAGQGWYVWPSYFGAALCIAAEVLMIKQRQTRAKNQLKQFINLKRVQENESEA